mmetsp:Transcript_25568/g.59618  ORF Transcript_25568/g.59618 Transcript_25568/m.59618 type:complete len:236 (-) Transcript_25568:292-999(-)
MPNAGVGTAGSAVEPAVARLPMDVEVIVDELEPALRIVQIIPLTGRAVVVSSPLPPERRNASWPAPAVPSVVEVVIEPLMACIEVSTVVTVAVVSFIVVSIAVEVAVTVVVTSVASVVSTAPAPTGACQPTTVPAHRRVASSSVGTTTIMSFSLTLLNPSGSVAGSGWMAGGWSSSVAAPFISGRTTISTPLFLLPVPVPVPASSGATLPASAALFPTGNRVIACVHGRVRGRVG